MELKKLTVEYAKNMTEQGHRRIYLVDFSENYLEELLEKYEISDLLAGILSDVEDRVSGSIKKGSKSVSFRDMELPVYPYRYFSKLKKDADFIILSDYFKETYEKLCDVEEISPEVQKNVYYFANLETEIELQYRAQYKDIPLEDTIVFRSGPHASAYVRGMDFADNARALFEYLLAENYNEKYKLVWFVKNPGEFGSYAGIKNVEFMSFDWSVSQDKEERCRYYHALCLAKYIFFTDAYGFCRSARADQIRVQLWHGCGFKTRINFVRCEKRYEYNIVISEVYRKIHSEIYGLREEQVLVTGYPKNDWLFHQDKGWKKKLDIPEAGHYIFWLPTFRTPVRQLEELKEKPPKGQTGLPVVGRTEEMKELNDILRWEDAILVIKLHPFQNSKLVHCEGMSNIVLLTNEKLVERDIQINQILGAADGLISDYSSVAVDYTLLDRPIGFTLDDIKEYTESRGFVFENIREWLPGKEIFSFHDFCQFIREVVAVADSFKEVEVNVDSTREKRRKVRKKMHQYQDARSCERLVEILKIERGNEYAI